MALNVNVVAVYGALVEMLNVNIPLLAGIVYKK